jgi:O-antigen ligase
MNVDFFINAYTSQQIATDYTTFSLIDSRVTGVFLNPNNLGFYMLAYALYFYFSNHTYKWYFFLLACVLFVFSQSRTVLIAAVIIAGIEFLRVVIFSKTRKINYWLVGGIVTIGIAISLALPNTRSLIKGTAFQSSSFQKRIQIFQNVGAINKDSFLIGQGHLTNIPQLIGGYIDSEYAYLYLEYGVFGLLLVLGVFTLTLFTLWKRNQSYFYLYSLVLFVVIGFTNLSFSNYEIIPYFIVLGVLSIKTSSILEETKR